MKKAARKEYTLTIVIVVLCLIFFGLGVSVPLIFDRSSKQENTSEKEKFDAIYSLLTNEWYFSKDVEDLDQKLMEKAIEGMTDLEEDPHTQYFDLESAKAFSDTLEGSNVGLGISYFLNDQDQFVIRDVFLNSPAEQAGLKKGDIITDVDGLSCEESDSQKILKRIQSKEGKSIEIVYLRDGQSNTVKITPTEYDQTVVCMLHEDQGYGEIILTSFSEHSGEDFSKAMARLQKAGIKKVVLDLRGNTGGYLSAAVDIASSLLPGGSVIFQEEQKDGTTTSQSTNDDYGYVPMDRIVILQNDTTASASEALIGALRDNLTDKVVTIGTTSYGKGTEQTTVPFSDGTSIKYTIAKWLTPNGDSIHEKGFTPDIEVQPEDVSKISYTTSLEEETITKDTVHANASALQQFLKYLGYSVDRTDEYFSPVSSEALKQFQSDNGLSPTGDCDPDTWQALKQKALLKYNEETLVSDVQRDRAIQEITK
ncbi:S41 family peptidase [Faecalicoccus pleomorphus]|uniref:S41 family peptidase n=1 Tax=Faecalicoccus pleomorphus TaxID=1323 RepID=UPI0019611002|nr:S41 family peptidase [Faecalicoccus pleomorphus]MBM6765618.1 S41 family peptidase [Faecalicoccus pleomorphus]